MTDNIFFKDGQIQIHEIVDIAYYLVNILLSLISVLGAVYIIVNMRRQLKEVEVIENSKLQENENI